ncbi:MAG: phosphate ABC transporter ATP-binding protein [Odoribacter sp.]
MNIPFLGKKIKWYMSELNETELKQGVFRPNQKFCTDETKRSNIVVENLNVTIQHNLILKNVSAVIPSRKITCIIGPSGCGKSTLLKSLNRLLDMNEDVKISGKVVVDGEELYVPGVEVTHIRRKMGLLSQRPCPLPMSIYDNIAYGCRIHGIRNRKKLNLVVRYYLEAVGLWDEVKDRLHTPAIRMSIGQQQRLCLARGLAVEPLFILADEATSALDPISSKTIEDLFLKLKEEYAIVLVTHTLRQALRIADYVIFMYMGEIIEAGPAEEIFKHPKEELTQKYLTGVFS